MSDDVKQVSEYVEAVNELLARISDGRKLINEGNYPLESAYHMAERQAERVAQLTPNPSSTEGTEERKQRIKERAELDESIFSAGVAAEHQRIREAVVAVGRNELYPSSTPRWRGYNKAVADVLAIIDSTTEASTAATEEAEG